jgi:hypothetical protein
VRAAKSLFLFDFVFVVVDFGSQLVMKAGEAADIDVAEVLVVLLAALVQTRAHGVGAEGAGESIVRATGAAHLATATYAGRRPNLLLLAAICVSQVCYTLLLLGNLRRTKVLLAVIEVYLDYLTLVVWVGYQVQVVLTA